MAYTMSLPVRFGDCDIVGIGYYPRLLALADAAIEDWTVAVIGVDRAAMHIEHRRGMPTVTLETSFTVPCRLGEILDFTIDLLRVGRSSIDLAVAASVAGETRFTGRYVQVLIDTDSGAAAAWPDAWRAALVD